MTSSVGGHCLCFGFTGSNVANNGCYYNNGATYREMCSYEVATYSPCGYSTGTTTPPTADSSCGPGAKWGHPDESLKSHSSTEDSIAKCYNFCQANNA